MPQNRTTPCGNKTQRQNGNALWFILIVVALFAALTATLSRNTGSVNQAGDIEQASVKAAAILRYTTAIETTIQKMMLEGISENSLNFEALGSDYENTSCTEDHCKVFGAKGGGVPYRDLSSVISEETNNEWIISAQNFVYLAGCDDEDNSCTDLLMIAPGIPLMVCKQINSIQGIANTNGAPPQMETLLTDEAFDGTYTSTVNSYTLGGDGTGEATEVQGRNSACVQSGDTYYFYQLLLTR